MDFQSLSRRDLQSLCKKNKIPANLTNAAMADALQSLQSVEGLAEVKETLQFQSPKKPDLLSPAVPRTSRRAASRTKVVVDDEEKEYDVPKERQGSPLPRSRRVTARASEILSMVDAADDGVEKGPSKKEVDQTPKVPTTRRKAADAPTVQKTVATRRRAADGKEVENAAVGVTTGRRTRQLSKKQVSAVGDDLMSGGLKRSTRGRGRSAAVSKMSSLSKEEEDEDQKKEAEVSFEQNNHEVAVNKEEEKKITEELGSKDQDCESDQVLEEGCGDETIQDEKQEKSIQESSRSAEEASENNQNQEGCGLLSGLDDSPIRGLITSDQPTNDEQQQNLLAEEMENAERSSEQEEQAIATGDGELNPAETGDSGAQSPDVVACDQTDISGQTLAAESKESGEGNGEKDTVGDEITAEATEIELTVESPDFESPAKQPQEDNVTGEGNGEVDTGGDDLSFSLANREITAEAAELDLTVEFPAIESPEKQPHEDDVTGDGNGEVDTGGEDLSFSPANGEIVEEATELELAVDSPAKQPTEGDATGEGNGGADTVGDGLSFSPASGEIAEEATEPDLTVESPAIDSPAKQPNEDDVTGEGDDLSFSPSNDEIEAEAAEPDLTVEAPAIESPAKQPNEDDVTVEGDGEADTGVDGLSFSPANGEIAAEATDPELTVESPATESPAKQPKEDDVTLDLGPADNVAADIAVQIPVEVDESGADLSGNNVLAGEISVEAIGGEKQPSLQADIGGEYMDEVLVELMDDLSDLKLSAGSELPVAGIHRERKGSDDKENGRLTESNAAANGEVVGPLGMKTYEEMSLRKLKAAYKETLLSKGGEKRAALKAIDVNKDGAANIF